MRRGFMPLSLYRASWQRRTKFSASRIAEVYLHHGQRDHVGQQLRNEPKEADHTFIILIPQASAW